MKRKYKIGSMKRGFTLIELLVVISIIGLLSSIALASLSTARIKGRVAVRLRNLTEIRTAMYLYAQDNGGNFPPSGGGSWGNLTSYTGGGASCPNWDQLATALAPHIKTLPIDPRGHSGSLGNNGVCPYYPGDSTLNKGNFYFYTNNFTTHLGGSGTDDNSMRIDDGTCLHKRVLIANNIESTGGLVKQECTLGASGIFMDPNNAAYYMPNAIILVLE